MSATCLRCHFFVPMCTCTAGPTLERARSSPARALSAPQEPDLFANGADRQPAGARPLTSLQRGMRALHDTAAKHAAGIDQLAPLARELADRAGADGITVSDLRVAAVRRGLLRGDERGRELSWLGAVLQRAGLVRTDEYRRSEVERSHGNLHRVFVAPEFAS